MASRRLAPAVTSFIAARLGERPTRLILLSVSVCDSRTRGLHGGAIVGDVASVCSSLASSGGFACHYGCGRGRSEILTDTPAAPSSRSRFPLRSPRPNRSRTGAPDDRSSSRRHRRRRAPGPRSFLASMLRGVRRRARSSAEADSGPSGRIVDRASEKPDLALLDLHMPSSTGSASSARSRSTEMPLVAFVTAYEDYASAPSS